MRPEREVSLNGGGEESRIFLAATPEVAGQEVPLAETASQALAAWEARAGEVLTVTAPDGRLFRARMLGEKGRIAAALCFEDLGIPPTEPFVHLCQAFPEKERFELVLEKATELGVDALHPFVSQRSSSLETRDAGQKKSHRWPHLLRRASRQCRRPDLPLLFPARDFEGLLELALSAGLCLVLDERERELHFSEALSRYAGGSLVLVVGPEGGLTREEVTALRRAGAHPVTLGRRILRTETAAIMAVGLARYHSAFPMV